MTAHCESPVPFETLVAYWTDDLAPSEARRVEEHMMGCAECASTLAGVASIGQAVRALIPPILSREAVTQLRARGARVVENLMQPGQRKPVTFPRNVDVLLHRLGGLNLAQATRVCVTVGVEETGAVIFENEDAPFDREAGEILIACQRHFAALPPNVVFRVRFHDASGVEDGAVYTVPHTFV
jgi:anti-sigma factor RsiW